MIKQTLQKLGLTEIETEIYLTLLKNGELSVNDISMKTGIYRQVCYDSLDRLLEKGFISFVSKNSKKFFKALNPEKILDYLEEKNIELNQLKDSVNNVLPELIPLYQFKQEETNIEVIKGKKVIRTVLRDVINSLKLKKDALMMLNVEETVFIEEDKIAIEQYLRDLKIYGIKEKLIAKKDAKIYFSGENSEYRVIDAKYFNPNPIYIYNGKVVQLIWGNPNYAVIITSKQIYDSYCKHFEMLWEIAESLK